MRQAVTGAGRVVGGRYELLDLLGQGAMGTVWRARDPVLSRDVAIKEIRLPGLMSDAERQVLRERTLREARVAGKLSHPGVVTVYDVVEADGNPWIVMEFVPARSLERVITADGPLGPGRVAEIGVMLCEALASAHAAGIVHRDVKPANVLITGDGRAVLTDFGIATLEGEAGLTQAGMVMGTPGFCAPERIRGEPASPASDLWSLGATLFAAVEGQAPYHRYESPMAVVASIVHSEPPTPRSAGALRPVIGALMSREPVRRPSALSAARMLARAMSGDAADGIATLPSRSAPGTTAAPPGFATPGTTASPTAPAAGPAGQPGAAVGGERTSGHLPARYGGVPADAQRQPEGDTQAAPPPVRPAQPRGPSPARHAAPGPAQRLPHRREGGPSPRRRWLVIAGTAALVICVGLLVGAFLAHPGPKAPPRRSARPGRHALSGRTGGSIGLPAGYHWYSVAGGSLQPGFAVALPQGWPVYERGAAIIARGPGAAGSVRLAWAPGISSPRSRVAAIARQAAVSGQFPGYRQAIIGVVRVRGTLAASLRFRFTRPGAGRMQGLVVVARLGPLGRRQTEEFTAEAPATAWQPVRAALAEALRTFRPAG